MRVASKVFKSSSRRFISKTRSPSAGSPNGLELFPDMSFVTRSQNLRRIKWYRMSSGSVYEFPTSQARSIPQSKQVMIGRVPWCDDMLLVIRIIQWMTVDQNTDYCDTILHAAHVLTCPSTGNLSNPAYRIYSCTCCGRCKPICIAELTAMLAKNSELSVQIRKSGNGHMHSSRSAWMALTVKGGVEIVDHISLVTDFVRTPRIFDFSTSLRDAILMMDQKSRGELS